MVVSYLFWVAFCITDGAADAFMYHLKDVNKSSKPNEHSTLLLRRIIIGILLCYYSETGILGFLIYGASQPFFHNNVYYNIRHYLNRNVYSYGLNCQSKTSTAFLTKVEGPAVRITLFILSITFIWLRNLGHL